MKNLIKSNFKKVFFLYATCYTLSFANWTAIFKKTFAEWWKAVHRYFVTWNDGNVKSTKSVSILLLSSSFSINKKWQASLSCKFHCRLHIIWKASGSREAYSHVIPDNMPVPNELWDHPDSYRKVVESVESMYYRHPLVLVLWDRLLWLQCWLGYCPLRLVFFFFLRWHEVFT